MYKVPYPINLLEQDNTLNLPEHAFLLLRWAAPLSAGPQRSEVGDVEQWPKALERCLKRFPTAAGRLRQVKKDRLAPVWPSRRLAAEGLGWKRL